MQLKHHAILGLTVLDLITTLAISIIGTVVAVPNVKALIAKQTLRAQTNRMIGAIHAARKLSVDHLNRYTICPSDNGSDCDNTYLNWANGYIIFRNDDNDANVDTGEPIFRFVDDISTDIKIQTTSGRRRITYRENGYGTNVTMRICHKDYPDYNRAIVLSVQGRLRLAYEDSNGDAYQCD